MYHRLGARALTGLPAFLDKWIQHKDHCKQKKFMEPSLQSWKLYTFHEYLFISYWNAALMGVQDCCEKGTAIDTNMTWEKANSLYDNLKQMDGEGPKAQEFNGKGWSGNFRKRSGLKMSR